MAEVNGGEGKILPKRAVSRKPTRSSGNGGLIGFPLGLVSGSAKEDLRISEKLKGVSPNDNLKRATRRSKTCPAKNHIAAFYRRLPHAVKPLLCLTTVRKQENVR